MHGNNDDNDGKVESGGLPEVMQVGFLKQIILLVKCSVLLFPVWKWHSSSEVMIPLDFKV